MLPSDGIGIVILANADEKHSQELAVAYRIIEDYLGLDHKASTRYASTSPPGTNTSLTLQPEPQIPASTMSSVSNGHALPLQHYTGKYTNVGYPTLVFCDPKSSRDVLECQSVLETFALLDDFSSSNDTLYCAIPSLWASHARIRRIQGNLFEMTASSVFLEGYGKDKSPFEAPEKGEPGVNVQFVIDGDDVRGFAMNGFVGETTERERRGGTAEETAEVWYAKA